MLEIGTHVRLVVQPLRVCVGLVEIEESAYAELSQPVASGLLYLEVTHGEVREVVMRQIVKQEVVVDRIGRIGNNNRKIRIALCRHGLLARKRVERGYRPGSAAVPQASEVVHACAGHAPFFQAFYNRLCNGCDVVFGIGGYKAVQLAHHGIPSSEA